jgi:hypothetical protein
LSIIAHNKKSYQFSLQLLDLQSSNSKYLNQLKRIAHPALLTRSKLPEPKVLLLQGESPFSTSSSTKADQTMVWNKIPVLFLTTASTAR